MVNTRRTQFQRASFTLVELLVAMAVFLVLMVVLAGFLSQASKLWSTNVQQAEEFQSARFAFQGMTQKLSQATLNTYWDYNSTTSPTTYIRQSDLQFTSGLATNLLVGTGYATSVSTHAVFFTAPLGMTQDTSKRSLVGLLNAVGYFISFGQLPQSSLISSPAPYRYALYEFFQPTENLQIYSAFYQTFSTAWFTNYFTSPPPANPPYHVFAPNVVALILRPDDGTYNTALAPAYFYDSKSGSTSPTSGSYTAPTTTSVTFNQLPPVVHVTMVAIDEPSATRLAQQYGSSAPPLLASSPFASQANFATDLGMLTNSLGIRHLNYHIFNADVPIRSAKWSP